MRTIRWLNIEAYGATLEMWRNTHGQFYFAAIGGTKEAKEAFVELGGERKKVFDTKAILFPPLSGEASSNAWIARLPKAFIETRDSKDVLTLYPDANSQFAPAMIASLAQRASEWEARAQELERLEAERLEAERLEAERRAAEQEALFDFPGFADDADQAQEAPTASRDVADIAAQPESSAPVTIAEPAAVVVNEAPAIEQVQPEPPTEPIAQTTPAVAEEAPAVEQVPVAAPVANQPSLLEQFIRAIHDGDDRPLIFKQYPQMPQGSELAEIEAMAPSAGIVMSPWWDALKAVLNRMTDDAQLVMISLGRSPERMIANANQFLSDNPGFPLISAAWGSPKNNVHRLVLITDATLPERLYIRSLDNEALPHVNTEVEMAHHLNNLWRETYGQTGEIVDGNAVIQQPRNAADTRADREPSGARQVSGASNVAGLERVNAAGHRDADRAGSISGADDTERAGRIRPAVHGDEQPRISTREPADSGDVRRDDTGQRASAREPRIADRELPDGGNERGHSPDTPDLGRSSAAVSGYRAERRGTPDAVAGGAPAANSGRPVVNNDAPVEADPVVEVELASSTLTEEEAALLQAEIEERRAARRRGMDLGVVENAGRVPYATLSNLDAQGTMMPANMATAITGALAKLSQRRGDVDEFVSRALGFDSPAELRGRLYAEQVDGLALTFDAFDRGRDMVLGDLTGIGKGRQIAGVIRFAYQQGLTAIFITKEQTLYNSMAREMAVLGMADVIDQRHLLITNSGVGIENELGEELVKGRSASTLQEIYETGELPQGIRVVFTTHSQLSTKADTPRANWLRQIAQDSTVIVDESHLSAGVESLCGVNVRAIMESARHNLSSSATSAKEAKNLGLYRGTDLSLLGNQAQVMEILQKGGAAAMEAVPLMLAQEGQYRRLEHDMSQAEYLTPDVPEELAPQIRTNMDALSTALRALLDLQSVVSQYNQDVNNNEYIVRQRMADERRQIARRNREVLGLSSMHFSSTLHHFSQQALLAVHADWYADLAIQSARDGNKPVLVVQSTMESVLNEVIRVVSEHDVPLDDLVVEMNFGNVLKRMANKITEINVNFPDGAHRFNLQDDALHLEGRGLPEQLQIILAGGHLNVQGNVRAAIARFNTAVERIPNSIPVSPIDYINDKITAAGFPMGELTGRKWRAEQVAPGTYRITRRSDSSKRDRQRIVNAFNSGEMVGLTLNRAGATGIDLHADRRFSDQRKRDMLLLQADDDIYNLQQALGRVFRANMVEAPRYTIPGSAVPVAVRSMAIMRRRLSNMMSLTRGSRDSEMTSSMPDIFNWVGCEAALKYLEDNPGVAEAIGLNLAVEANKINEQGGDTGLASRVTAMGLLLPCTTQDEMMDGLISAYENKLEELEQRGVNPFRSRHMDVKAEVVNEVTLYPATGTSVFESEIKLKELRYHDELPALSPDTIRTLISIGRASLTLAEGASRNWSRKPLLEVMDTITARLENTLATFRGLFDEGANQTLEEQANSRYDSLTTRAARDYLSVRAFADRVKLGGHLHLKLDSDAPIDLHIVGIEPPSMARSMHDPFEWRMLLVSKEQHCRQVRIPLATVISEAMQAQKQAYMQTEDADPAAFVYDWANLANLVSDPQQDLIDENGNFVPEIMASYENLPRGQIEMRRHVLSGNLLKAISLASDLGKGLPSTYTLANGSREFGVMMPSNFDQIRLLEMPVDLGSSDTIEAYICHRAGSMRKATLYMNLKDLTVTGVPAKEIEDAKSDRKSNFYLEVNRTRTTYTAKLIVPRAKNRSSWLVENEAIKELTHGMEWTRSSGDLVLTFDIPECRFSDRLDAILDQLIEMGITFRTSALDSRAREWLTGYISEQIAARDQDNAANDRAIA